MSALLGDEDEESFFEKLAAGDPHTAERWQTYLYHLALAIHDMHLLYNEDFILGGYMASHLREQDLQKIYENIERISPFPETLDYVHLGKMPKHSITYGAALPYIHDFLTGNLIDA